MKNNQNYLKLVLQWILLQINYTIAELRGDALNNTKNAHAEKRNSKQNWEKFIKNDADISELIWIANCELEEIMQKYSLKKRGAYNWRMRARVELGEISPNKEYPKRKFHK